MQSKHLFSYTSPRGCAKQKDYLTIGIVCKQGALNDSNDDDVDDDRSDRKQPYQHPNYAFIVKEKALSSRARVAFAFVYKYIVIGAPAKGKKHLSRTSFTFLISLTKEITSSRVKSTDLFVWKQCLRKFIRKRFATRIL